MTTLATQDCPHLRGVATVRVINSETGEVKQEVTSQNLVMGSLWDGLFFNSIGNNYYFPSSRFLFQPRCYISTQDWPPNPYEQSVGGVLGTGTNHPDGWLTRGQEQGTGWPYLEIHNLFQVTGTARTFYSLGLIGTITIPTNNYGASGTTLNNHLTRLLLPEPITQGVSDQLDIRYRLYFEEAAGSKTNPVFWAWLLDWAFNTSSQLTYNYNWFRSSGVNLAHGGVGWQNIRSSYNQPNYQVQSYYNGGALALNIKPENFGTSLNEYLGRSFEGDLWRWGTSWQTNRNYGHGIIFNEWWPRGLDVRAYYPQWLGPQQGWGSTSLNWSGSHYHTPAFYASATTEAGPFHNSFNHAADSMKLVYNVNALPRTTWRAVFGGTWAADDRLPLFIRAWWSEGGALNGSAAKYKLAFARTLSTRRGYPYDEAEATWGSGTVEAFQSETDNYSNKRWPGGGIWQRATDLMYGHTEYTNSRFGNLGYYVGGGWTSDGRTTAFNANSDRVTFFDMKKYPGLTMNTWWGYQSGKNGKAAHLGVEWRRLYPLERRVWQGGDIDPNLTKIDWMEPCNGVPGELDEEIALVVDSTSGIYLLNATQNTVTKLTGVTGFFRCSYSRDPATGAPIYVALRLDGSSVGIRTNWGGLAFQGSNDETWGVLGDGDSGVLHASKDLYDFPDRSPYNLATASMGTTRAFVRKRHFGQFRNDLGEFSNSAWLQVGQGSSALTLAGDLTIECWAYQTTRSSYVTLFELGSYTNSILFRIGSGSDAIWTSGAARFGPYTDNTTDLNTWVHWAVTRSGSTVRVFKNGALLTSWTDAATWNPAGNRLHIGARYGSGGENLTGFVSDFRITGAARYTAAFTPPTAHFPWGAAGAATDPFWSQVRVLLPMHARSFGTITGGSGYANGTLSLPLTGGSGSGATAEVVVSGGAVAEVKLVNGGSGYRYGDTLTATLSPVANPTYGQIQALATGVVGGSGYADGTYTGVTLTGGTGSGATANVTVSGGTVSAVVLVAGGTGYVAGNTLSATDANLGGLATGSGFAVQVLSADSAATLSTTPWSLAVETLRSPEPSWWSDGNKDRLIMFKPHYRFPHIFMGIMGTATDYFFVPCHHNARTGASGIQVNQGWWVTSYAFEGEYFGDAGEGSTGINRILVSNMRLSNWRNVLWPDWLTFEPNGLCAWVGGLYAYGYNSTTTGWIIYTADGNFGGVSYDERWGKIPWAAPHGYTGIPNAAGGPPHSTYGEIRSLLSLRRDTARCNMDCPYVIKGVSTESSFAWRQSCQPMTQFGTKAPGSDTSYGSDTTALPTSSAGMAGIYDMVSNGRHLENGVERYKGLIINGGIMGFVSNLFCQRTHAAGTSYQGYPSSWPISPSTDTVILNPMRWDVFGWDAANGQWVREQWAYNYDTLTWQVDPATVFPGRPAPSGGGTHTLPGVTQYPYSGLNVTFADVRPENSVAPTLGEWSGQYAYNGCIMDGVTEYTFSNHLSARPMKQGAIGQVIPADGAIKLPESFSARFQRVEPYDMNMHELYVNGVRAEINTTAGFARPSAGQVAFGNLSHLVFNQADAGKTVTGSYTFLEYAEQDNPLQWARSKVGREPIVQSSANDLLGGSAYKTSATLVAEGWTVQASGNPTTSHVINASAFTAYLPNGFPAIGTVDGPYRVSSGARYAERLAFIQDSVGVHWCNASTTPANSDFGNPATTTSAPTYGSLQLLFSTSHGITDIHWRAWTDGAGKQWLIFRVQWWFSATGNPIVAELWYDVANPWKQEWRQGVWTATNANYTGTLYHGIVHRTNGTGGYYQVGSWPDGTPGQYGSTTNVNTFHLLGGGPEQLAYKRFTIDLDPHNLLGPATP